CLSKFSSILNNTFISRSFAPSAYPGTLTQPTTMKHSHFIMAISMAFSVTNACETGPKPHENPESLGDLDALLPTSTVNEITTVHQEVLYGGPRPELQDLERSIRQALDILQSRYKSDITVEEHGDCELAGSSQDQRNGATAASESPETDSSAPDELSLHPIRLDGYRAGYHCGKAHATAFCKHRYHDSNDELPAANSYGHPFPWWILPRRCGRCGKV
ncbi:hypothetical protein K402DRAFT_428576, partial [Aulographum hederae CBS 113979]